ncbi:hypothetical protein H2O64_02155 [Kordia sp. YSTF-M3]|uniref:Uncharacterized protein n=1 Tax=Kordia aestuariivivens TaxID=2759037 RepID=A0ABR7Q4Z8_9FLAO|nr:DUF6695 family protein [Kordia aestuariivivens]MBC8753456.1 hypothetical protein [Kordia aestuariivivens]
MNNSGTILTLAYPDTIVMTAEEWYSPYLRFIGIGKKKYVRAGHAALVLINNTTGVLSYHDFGRYITAEPHGRVRGKMRDRELDFPIKARIVNGTIANLDEILQFLANNPKLTHGDGKLLASVCDAINYEKALECITHLQRKGSMYYAAFKKESCNCARFVTTTLIASLTNEKVKKALKRSTWFTPSTVGNVVLANTQQHVYEVIEDRVEIFTSTSRKETIRCFLDRLKDHTPNFIGTLEPKQVKGVEDHAQWLPGIACGSWFEIHSLPARTFSYRIRRIAPYGNIDVDGIFKVNDPAFDIQKPYQFIHNSNCLYCNILQNGKVFYFSFQQDYILAIQ